MIIDRNLCHTIIIIKIIHPDLGNIFFSKFLYLFKTKLEYIYNLNIPTKKKKEEKNFESNFLFHLFSFLKPIEEYRIDTPPHNIMLLHSGP